MDKATLDKLRVLVTARIQEQQKQHQLHGSTNSERMHKVPHRGGTFFTHGQLADIAVETKHELNGLLNDLNEMAKNAVSTEHIGNIVRESQALGGYLETAYPKEAEAMAGKSHEEVAMAILESQRGKPKGRPPKVAT